MQEQRRFMRVSEVAAALGVGKSRVYAMLAAGRLPHVREGRTIRIPIEAFEIWFQKRVKAALLAATSEQR